MWVFRGRERSREPLTNPHDFGRPLHSPPSAPAAYVPSKDVRGTDVEAVCLQVQALKALSLLTPFNGALARASSQNIPKVPSLLFDIEVSSRGMN